MRYALLGLLLTTALAQSPCPYVRYLRFDACGPGGDEGLNEFLFLWSGGGFNIDNLRISFPIIPNGTGLDCDSPTRWVCNGTGCTVGWTCPASLVSTLNSTACTGTTFVCLNAGDNVPANRWVMLFTGNAPTAIPDASAFCGAGTVYVAVAGQTNGQGRYLNTPTAAQNRRTRVVIDGMPACSMTVNYRGAISTSVNGRSLLIDPSVCLGLTQGLNGGCPGYTAPTAPDYCYYSDVGQNGVSLYTPTGDGCPLPPLSVLPVLWSYVRVEGSELRWAAEGLGADAAARLGLWHSEGVGRPWVQVASGLPLVGRYPLSRPGLYQLRATLAAGGESESPIIAYTAPARPYLYPNPAPDGPFLGYAEMLERLVVFDVQGQRVADLIAPISREALRGLPSGLYLVRFTTAEGEISTTLWVP